MMRNENNIIISRWLVGIIVTVLLAVIPAIGTVIYMQGQQSEKLNYVVEAMRIVLEKLPRMDITLANHDARIENIERELYHGKKARKEN
jgi:hypothetical protein